MTLPPPAHCSKTMLEGFTSTEFSFEGVARTVYRRGRGPCVLIMHEIPGITPEVARFAALVADRGFSVALPSLFGTPNRPRQPGYLVKELAAACVRREFAVLAARQSSPLTEWLRALSRYLHAEIGGRGIGALGMCITGNFALALMVDEHVMAPVLSQPSLPFPFGAERKAGLHLSDADLLCVKRRAEAGAKLVGLRFTHDKAVPKERFERLRTELGDAFESIEIDSGPANARGIPRRAHSVLTNDFVDAEGHPTRAALDRVLAFFQEQLGDPA